MSSPQDEISHGTPEMYRQEIAAVCASAGIYTELVAGYAAVGNDAGLAHAVRCLVACTKSARGLMVDLHDMKERQAARAAAPAHAAENGAAFPF